MLVVPANITAPASITLIFNNPTFGPDLTTVSAITLNVTRRDGTATTWAMTIVSSTPNQLTAQYTFTGGTEITTAGMYYLAPVLTIPGGTIPAAPISLFVSNAGNLPPQVQDQTWVTATVPVPTLGPYKVGWVNLTSAASPYAAIATSPWLALDLSTAGITVNLWAAGDGDNVVLTDYKNAAASHVLTLVANGTSKVPNGDGTFSGTTNRSTAGFSLRLKFQASAGLWLPW